MLIALLQWATTGLFARGTAHCARSNRILGLWLLAWTASCLLTILTCAAVFTYEGLITAEGWIQYGDFARALYFSVTTWTTLGYGDLVPTESLGLFAAHEGLLGLTNMAFIVLLAGKYFERRLTPLT